MKIVQMNRTEIAARLARFDAGRETARA